MRIIGYLPGETDAKRFADYLYGHGVTSHLEKQPPEGWAVWVEDEDKLAEASGMLAAFRANPTDPQFQAATSSASARRQQQEKEQVAYERRIRGGRDLFRPLTGYGFGPVTFVLIAISVGVFILSNFGRDTARVMVLFISEYTVEGSIITYFKHLAEVRHGQVWRLVTPIFVHMNILHILFNMLWLRDLGSMIEGRQGAIRLVVLVLVIAVASNVGQFYGSGPVFGGMSGVVYGLLGYVWLRGKYDPGSGLFLHSTTVVMMLIWFFACLVGIIPNVANWAHGVGFAVGLAWGYLSALRAPMNRRR